MESCIASVKIDVYWFGWGYDVGFDSFASRTVLRDGAAEYHKSILWWLLEQFEPLLNLNDGVHDVFAGGRGLYVRRSAVLVSQRVQYVTNLLSRRHIY